MTDKTKKFLIEVCEDIIIGVIDHDCTIQLKGHCKSCEQALEAINQLVKP